MQPSRPTTPWFSPLVSHCLGFECFPLGVCADDSRALAAGITSGLSPDQWEGTDAANMRLVVQDCAALDLVVRNAPMELVKCRPQLNSCQVRPETPVKARGKAGVRDGGTVDIDLKGLREHLGIKIGRRPNGEYLGAGREEPPVHLHIVDRLALAGRNSGFEAHQLFNGIGPEVGVRNYGFALFGV